MSARSAPFICAIVLATGCTRDAGRPPDDGPESPLPQAGAVKNDESLEWRWSKDKASLAYSVKQHLPDYEVRRVNGDTYYTPIEIRSKRDGTLLYALQKGSESIVFTRRKDTLYIAEYWPIASGCEVVALDLTTGKQLWRSRLQGIGPTLHSQYLNLVNIATDGQRIIVAGNEAHGRYVEVLDPENGKILANRKLDADPKSLLGE
jgi:outer membrane protein assembly factor BamB